MKSEKLGGFSILAKVLQEENEAKLKDFVKRCFLIRSPYGKIEDVSSVHIGADYLSVDLEATVNEPEGSAKTVYTIDLTDDGTFYLMDFNLELDLGSSPEEAANSIRIILEEGHQSAILQKKK